MSDNKNIFPNTNAKNSLPPFNVPKDYFQQLNDKIIENAVLSNEKRTPIFKLNVFYKCAAAIALIIGSYLLFNIQNNTISINYEQLSDSIDDYLSNDDEVFYTFIDDIESSEYLNVDENLTDYLEFEF